MFANLTEEGSLYIWGDNSDGQCGIKNENYLLNPRKIEFQNPINSISCGYYHTAFISKMVKFLFLKLIKTFLNK